MIDHDKFLDALSCYKRDFTQKHWKEEGYKWEAIKHFQDNWNTKDSDFHGMLSRSLAKTYNLLTSSHNYAARMIKEFATYAPEEVRAMFIDLYDESKDVVQRIQTFKDKADILLKRYKNPGDQSFQTENAISVYLWLNYPDNYYIYKFEEVKNAAEKLGFNLLIKRKDKNKLNNFRIFYDELREELKKDDEIKNLLATYLTDTCYKDPDFRTLTVDFGFYVSRYYESWWPSEKEYTPGLKVEDWKNLLANPNVFNTTALEIMARMLANGGQGSCSELAKKYGESKNFYITGTANLAKRVHDETGCPLPTKDTENSKWWPILYIGKSASEDDIGSYIWKLRSELEEALKQTDLSGINLYAPIEEEKVDAPVNEVTIKPYSKKDFLKDVYMSEEKYDRLVSVLKAKKNIILQGPPGVGKTFAARKLAYSILGKEDKDKIAFVQFHQNYSYEDFVMGYKPCGGSFALKESIFYRFCKKAEKDPDNNYYFIIDEINRGNMSKIFGELLMLIEEDKREKEEYKVTLAYKENEEFTVPKNLHIIGMMNTADRSLAMIDYALRRRFSFFEMGPGFDTEGFKAYQKGLNNDTFDALIKEVKELNKDIIADNSLGEGFCIGHSYFCLDNEKDCTEEWMRNIVEFDIIPMLKEYWFDDKAKVEGWKNKFHALFQ